MSATSRAQKLFASSPPSRRGNPIGLAVGRTHEKLSARRSKKSSSNGRLRRTIPRLRSARAEWCRSASALRSSLGALEQIVV